MTRPVRFGVTLPQIKRTWSEASETARALDAMGYDSLWVCDHLYGVPMPNLPILEAFTELAAVAAITQRAKLGTLVTPPFFRNPAVLANSFFVEENPRAFGLMQHAFVHVLLDLQQQLTFGHPVPGGHMDRGHRAA